MPDLSHRKHSHRIMFFYSSNKLYTVLLFFSSQIFSYTPHFRNFHSIHIVLFTLNKKILNFVYISKMYIFNEKFFIISCFAVMETFYFALLSKYIARKVKNTSNLLRLCFEHELNSDNGLKKISHRICIQYDTLYDEFSSLFIPIP